MHMSQAALVFFFAMFIDFPCSFLFIFVFNNYQSSFLHNFDLFYDHTYFSLTTYRAKVLLNAVLDTYSGVLVPVLRSSVCSGLNFSACSITWDFFLKICPTPS